MNMVGIHFVIINDFACIQWAELGLVWRVIGALQAVFICHYVW